LVGWLAGWLIGWLYACPSVLCRQCRHCDSACYCPQYDCVTARQTDAITTLIIVIIIVSEYYYCAVESNGDGVVISLERGADLHMAQILSRIEFTQER